MKSSSQKGISLVEIMVAMVISIFLLGGVIQVFMSNRTTYNFSESVSRIQENGRFAMDFITRDLRMAGFWGCATYDPDDTSNITNNLNPAGPGYDPSLHDFANQPLIEGTENNGMNGSDSLTLRGAAPGQANVLPPYNSPTSAQVFINNGDVVQQDDIVLLTNCNGADVFQITNITQGGGTAKLSVVHNTGANNPGNYNPGSCGGGGAHCLSQTYGGDSAILRLQAVTYSIAAGASGEPALFRSLNGVNQELVDGVEQMQILYGVNNSTSNKSPSQYFTSATMPDTNGDGAPDWNDVKTARVMLLMKSENRVLDSGQSYTYNGTTTTSSDNMMRQVFSSTIALRNRI